MRGSPHFNGGGVVWKFGPLMPRANVIEMPKGAHVLHVGFQTNGLHREDLFVWALVNPAQTEKEQRRFGVLPTGHESLPNDDYAYKHIGTALTKEGLVWHAFEAIDRTKALLESLLG